MPSGLYLGCAQPKMMVRLEVQKQEQSCVLSLWDLGLGQGRESGNSRPGLQPEGH